VQKNAMAAWETGARFFDLLAADPAVTRHLSRDTIEAQFDDAYHLKQVDTIFRRVFG